MAGKVRQEGIEFCAISALAIAFSSFLKNIPVIGITPWLCRLLEAVECAAILYLTDKNMPCALVPCVLIPIFDVLTGFEIWAHVPLMVLAFAGAALIWHYVSLGNVIKVILSAAAMILCRMAGFCMDYISMRDIPLIKSLWRVLRNAWFMPIAYLTVLLLFALIYGRQRGKNR